MPASGSWRLTLSAGPRQRTQAPLALGAPDGVADGVWRLRREREDWPAQCAGGRLLFVLPHLAAGEERTYELVPGEAPEGATAEPDGASVRVRLGAEPFAVLHTDGAPRPFLHPVLAPGGISVVRGWPIDPSPDESTDHVHHRGVWVAHGDVNGMDGWADSNRGQPGGRMVVGRTTARSGAVCAHVALEVRWLATSGEAVMAERRLHRFWAVDGQARLIDIESTFCGVDDGPVRFGDTKEGGLCAVRVASGMEGSRGGRITTAEGAIGEKEAWGSAAGWCDYSGVPARQADGGRTVGVAIFDHPDNPLHPTRWHVRDYGLMTANPFALAAYKPRRGLRGDWEIAAGAEATFRYRVCVHTGGAAEAEVARRYADWAFAPRVRWEG